MRATAGLFVCALVAVAAVRTAWAAPDQAALGQSAGLVHTAVWPRAIDEEAIAERAAFVRGVNAAIAAR